MFDYSASAAGRGPDHPRRDGGDAEGVALPEAIRYALSIDSCRAIGKSTVTELTKITMRLGPVYEQQQSLEANGVWSIPVFGRHYQIEQHPVVALDTNAVACDSV